MEFISGWSFNSLTVWFGWRSSQAEVSTLWQCDLDGVPFRLKFQLCDPFDLDGVLLGWYFISVTRLVLMKFLWGWHFISVTHVVWMVFLLGWHFISVTHVVWMEFLLCWYFISVTRLVLMKFLWGWCYNSVTYVNWSVTLRLMFQFFVLCDLDRVPLRLKFQFCKHVWFG